MTADNACIGGCEGAAEEGKQYRRPHYDSVSWTGDLVTEQPHMGRGGVSSGVSRGGGGGAAPRSKPMGNDENSRRRAPSGGQKHRAALECAMTNGSWTSESAADLCSKWVELVRPIQRDGIVDIDAHDAKARFRLPPLRCSEGLRRRQSSRGDADGDDFPFVTCNINSQGGQASGSLQSPTSIYLDCMEPLTGDCRMLPAHGVGRPTKAGRGPVVDELLASPSLSPAANCAHAERPVAPIPRTRRGAPDAKSAGGNPGRVQSSSGEVPWWLTDDQSSFSSSSFSRLDGSLSSSSSGSSPLWSRRRFRIAPLDSAGSCTGTLESSGSMDSLGLMSLCSLDTTCTGGSWSRGSSSIGSRGCLSFSPLSPGLATKSGHFGAPTPLDLVRAHDGCRATSSSTSPKAVKRSLVL